jgi:galactokinase
MPSTIEPFTSIAPGRLCLFGEHQDYLHLPVLAVALPLYCRIQVQPTTHTIGQIRLQIPQLQQEFTYIIQDLQQQQQQSPISDSSSTVVGPNDFARSALLTTLQ